jgi:arylformamidase
MHRLIDVTLPLSAGLRSFPGDPPFRLEPHKRMADGAPFNVSRLSTGTHAGTHVDAPAHFVRGGATVDQLPLEILVGKARVLDVPGVETIGRQELEKTDLRDDIRVLIKTRMSAERYGTPRNEDSVSLSEDAATYLVQAGIKLVGFDDLSIDARDSTDFKAHHVLLGAGVIVVEGLDLAQVEPGDYDMTSQPLRLVDADGAPARVVLRMRP